MGTKFFMKSPHIGPTGTNLEARALGANLYSGRSAATRAAKDLGAASAARQNGLKPLTKTAAVAAPGPKKV